MAVEAATGIPTHLRTDAVRMAHRAVADLLLPACWSAFSPWTARPRGSLGAVLQHAAGRTTQEKYRAFLADPGERGARGLWQRRTVLADMGIRVAWCTVRAVGEAHRHLVEEPPDWLAPTVAQEVRAQALAADRHHGTAVLALRTATQTVAHRPRDVRAAAAVYGWLAEAAARPRPGGERPARGRTPGPRVRGVAEPAPHADPVRRARGLGAWWALLVALRGTDAHAENSVTSRSGVALVDLEVLATPRRLAPATPAGTSWPLASDPLSAFDTLVLPRWTFGADGLLRDMSPLAGTMTRQTPHPLPVLLGAGTDQAHLASLHVGMPSGDPPGDPSADPSADPGSPGSRSGRRPTSPPPWRRVGGR